MKGYVDSGNSFFNCIGADTFKKLGFKLSDLEESPTPAIKQAGGGATLQILGKMPCSVDNGFSFAQSRHIFPFKDMYVVDGLHHDFNISYTFLKENNCVLDFEEDLLIFKSENFEEEKYPLVVPPSSKTVFCGSLQPSIPSKGCNLRPLESVLLPLPSLKNGEFFQPWQCAPKGAISSLVEGPPWTLSVQGANATPPLLKITNNSTFTKTLFPSSRLGTICSMATPSQTTELSSPDEIHWDKVKRIQAQVKLDPEFESFENGLHDIILKYQKCVSWNGEPGKTNLGETEICTGSATPVFIPPNRFSPDVAKIVEKQIKKWLENGTIIPADNKGSRWNAKLLIVPKKQVEGAGKEWRVCADLRHLNKACIVDTAPFSPLSMQETFHMLGGSQVFSCLDLTQAFTAIPIKKEHRYKTAFIFQGRVYYFATTCFGLASAPSSLGKVLGKALADVPTSFCTYYMDDVIVYSKNTIDHLKHLTVVFKAILHSGLKLRLDKCNFFRKELEFLGHMITREGYTIVRSYIEPILEWPLITSKYEAQSFLGSANYYSEFIPFFATKAKALYEVLQRPGDDKAQLEFSHSEKLKIEASMSKLKNALVTAPILTFADFGPGASKFILDVDYSEAHHTIGCVLSQIQPPGSGRERVILFKAKSLKKSQHRYSAYMGEIFGACYFIEKLRYFLQLRKFILRVDCEALKWIRTQDQTPPGMVLRWLKVLAENDFEVVHRSRKAHQNADSLSRLPNAPPVSDSEDEGTLAQLDANTYDCPFCSYCAADRRMLDYHVDMEHMLFESIPYESWQQLQRTRKRNLAAAFAADPKVEHLARYPVRLEGTAGTGHTVRMTASAAVNMDDTVTYSPAQWAAFQRLDPPLKLAMDAIQGNELTEPLGPLAHAFVKEGEIDSHGVLRYNLWTPGGHPVKAAVVPFALQIAALMYFHQVYGCINQQETIRQARKYIYFKNMHQVFPLMRERCEGCARRNKALPPNKFQLISHKYVEPFHCIALDHVGPIKPVINGCQYLLTVKDLFSGWVEIFPVPSTEAQYVVQKVGQEICCRFGVPNTILTDNHSAFVGKTMTDFCSSLGITLKHSSPRNARSNFVERSHVDIKRKMNSKLRQQEAILKARYSCDLCGDIFTSDKKLSVHLNTHDLSELSEALASPAEEVSTLLKAELAARHVTDWVATIPSVLWSMRTARSETRGASPYEIIFGRQPTTSLDLMFGQKVVPKQFSTIHQYKVARARRNELANAFAKRNLSGAILRQRKYYTEGLRKFAKGDLVYLFTPQPVGPDSEKITTFWTGPWTVVEVLGPTTYKLEETPGKFSQPQKQVVTQVDRIKQYLPTDPVVTPPRNFDGNLELGDPDLEYIKFDNKKDLKLPQDKDALIDQETEVCIQQPPWQPRQAAKLPLPARHDKAQTRKTPLKKVPNARLERLKRKAAQQAATRKPADALPAPPLTRARAKLAAAPTLSSMSTYKSRRADDGFEHGEALYDENTYDPYIHHRYNTPILSG